jgi:hypothetical protein
MDGPSEEILAGEKHPGIIKYEKVWTQPVTR